MSITNLGSVTLLIAIAEAKSLAAAAHRLGLSPSAVSKALTRLERDFGTRLVARNTHHLALTEDGARLFDHFRRIAAQIEQAESDVVESRTSLRGRLRVQLPTAFGRKVVVPALGRFLRDYPNLGVNIEMSDRLIDLSQERVDISVRFSDIGGARLVASKLCTVRYVACASPAYLAAHPEPVTPEDLDRHRCLNYFNLHTGRLRDWQFADRGERFAKAISGPLNFNNSESLLDAAIAGLGIVMVATFLAAEPVRAGRLRIILRDYIAPGQDFYAVCLPHEATSPRVKAFTAFLRSTISNEAIGDQIADSRPGRKSRRTGSTGAARQAGGRGPRASSS